MTTRLFFSGPGDGLWECELFALIEVPFGFTRQETAQPAAQTAP